MVRSAALLVLVLAALDCGDLTEHVTTEGPALCPAGCYCGDSLDFEVSCLAGEVWVTLEVRRGEFLRVTCDNSTDDVTWRLFPTTAVLSGASTPAVSFSGCRTSHGSYGDIVRALGGRPELVRSLHVAVPADTVGARLSGLPRLTALSLRGARAGPLADLVTELPALTSLRLTDTDLKLRQDQPVLRGAGLLVTLEVGEGRLEELPDGAMDGLGGLRRLALWSVMLRRVEEGTLRGAGADVGGLRDLQLSGNRELRNLPRELLRPAPSLRRLALHDNALGELPHGFLDGLARLRELRLSDNRGEGGLQLPRGLCADLGELIELRADRCGLRALANDVLHGARALQELHLTDNKLYDLPRGLLKDQVALRVLRLDSNRLTALSPDTFSTLASLEELSLDGNQLGVLPPSLVSGASSLRVLSARHAGLHQVSAGSLRGARGLQVLLLSHNNLTLSAAPPSLTDPMLPELGPPSSLGPLPELRVLDVSHNLVSEVFSDWRLSMLQLQLLNLSHNKVGPLQFLSENVTVDLRHNLLTDLDLTHLELVGGGVEGGTTLLLLDDNPLECGCGLLGALRGAGGLRLDWGGARCAEPSGLRGEPVRTLPADRLTCELPPPECPEGCVCAVRPAPSRLELRCNVTADGQWPVLPQAAPLGLSDVTVTLSGAAPPGTMPPTPPELSSLVLSGLGLRSLRFLPSLPLALRSLDLRDNNLSHPRPPELRALLAAERRVFLPDNTLNCDCPDLPALAVLQEHARQIPMFSSLRCADGTPVSGASGARLCGRAGVWVWAAGLGGLAGIGLGALLWAGRRAVRALLVVRCGFGWLRPRDELGGVDQGRDYDVFVSHAHQDEGLALQLAERLEGSGGGGGAKGRRRLLLHFRDWRVGEPIPAQIARSVRAARRTLVLVSPAYLASSWAALELQEALQEPARLLAVVAGAPAAKDLESRPELRTYLTRHTYLRWGDPWFWEKLELALPPPRPTEPDVAEKRAPAAARATFTDRLPGLLSSDYKPPPADITLL